MIGKTDWWITMYDTVLRKQITKYFECEWDLDKYKRRLKYIPHLRLVEDSTDIYYNFD